MIGLGAVERAMAKRGKQPMLLVDLAVPRDIEPEVKNLVGITLYTVDDLAALVQMNQATPYYPVNTAEDRARLIHYTSSSTALGARWDRLSSRVCTS